MTRSIWGLIAFVVVGCSSGPPTSPFSPRIAESVAGSQQAIVSVTVNPGSDTLAFSAKMQLTATAFNSKGKAVQSAKFTWSSSDLSVVTVSGAGLLTGMGAGAATVTATSSTIKGTSQISVSGGTPPPPPPPPPPGTLRALASARGFLMGVDFMTDMLGGDTTIYRSTMAAQYNSITPRNAFMLSVIHPSQTTYNYLRSDQAVAFAQANAMKINGHILLWHAWNPVWLTTGGFDKTALLAIEKDYITTTISHYAGKVASWAVVNEGLNWDGKGFQAGVWFNTIGAEYIDSAFVWARRADPSAKLYYNDYGAEPLGVKADSVLALVTRLKARGIPIDAVGFQAHAFPAYSPAQTTVGANFQRFADAGFDIVITEMDDLIADTAGSSALITQAVVYRDILGFCLLQLRCTEFATFGGTDKWSTESTSFPGYGRATPFDSAYKAKPAFDSLVARLGR